MRGDALHSELTIGLADKLNVAPLGVGAWAWGTTRLWGYGKEYDRTDVGQAFRASMAEGVTLVDTAEMYGNGASERIIGEMLREGGFEGTPVIATKFAPLPYRFSAKSLLEAVDKSLERLGIETIDLYQIHFLSPILKINGLMDASRRRSRRARFAGWVSATTVRTRCSGRTTGSPLTGCRSPQTKWSTASCSGRRRQTGSSKRAGILA